MQIRDKTRADGLSVPVARRMLKQSLCSLGVDEAVTADIEVALTEACTNVLQHSGPGDVYQVSVELANHQCAVSVTDEGQGFDAAAVRAYRGGSCGESEPRVAIAAARRNCCGLRNKGPAG